MTIAHLSEVKTIARAATSIGAKLPTDITQALDHIEDIARNAPTPPRPGTIAAQLSRHVGDPVKLDKELARAATELASADAKAKIYGFLAETCGSRVRGMMREHAEQVASAFGAALADDLATLTQTAGLLPEWFRPEQAADLDPATFKAWTQARDAHARISGASSALTPLYSGAIGNQHGAHFPISAAAALRFAKPDSLDTPRDAYAFRDALAGRTERVQGLAGQGSTFVDGLFVPTVLAHTGASFEWATPSQVTERAEWIAAGMVREAARV